MALSPPQSAKGLSLPQSTPGLSLPDGVTDPLFGTYPEEQGLVGMGVAGQSLSQSVAGFTSSRLGALMHERQLQLLQAQGIPLDGDPNAWTPEEAAAQTDAAIAKIATVNPDLAEKLLSQRTGEPEDQSFFDNLKELAGDIISPVASLGSKALDLLTRPARIIPELMGDREDDPWYEDIGQALSGNSTATWSRVLDDMGVENGLVRAVAGFGLDVATDPLTYLTFGMAGVGRAMGARVASATIAKGIGREGLEAALKNGAIDLGARSVDDAAEALYKNLLTPGAFKVGAKAIDPDAAASIAARTLTGAEQQIGADMLVAADRVHRMVTTGGLANMPKEMALASGRKLTKEETYGILQAGMSQFSRKSWLQTKALAGAQGGARLRFAVPFTDLRYISPAIPGTAKLNFQVARRFVTGTSASTKLLHAIDAGQAGWDDFATWVDNGYKGLLESKPQLADVLKARNGSFGSRYYSVAESVGGMTANLAPHAKVWRGGGILGQMASDWNVLARGHEESLIALGWTHRREVDGAVVETTADEMKVRAAKVLKPDAEMQAKYAAYRELFPSREAAADPAAFVAQAREAGALRVPSSVRGTPAEDTFVEGLSERMTRLKAELSPEEQDVLHQFREMENGLMEEADRAGASILNTTVDLDGAASLNSADASWWNGTSRVDTRDLEFLVDSADGVGVDAARRLRQGFNVEDQAPTMGLGYGVRAVPANQGALPPAIKEGAEAAGEEAIAATRARIRLRKALVVGTTPESMLNDQGLLDELYAEAREVAATKAGRVKAAVENAPAQVGAAKTKLEKQAAALDIPDVERLADEYVTEALRKRGYDGIVEYGSDGSVTSATVFDARNVKRLNEDAPGVVAGRGYLPRMMTEQAQQFLDGKLPEDELTRFIYGSPKMHHDVTRKFGDLELDDAESEVRELLRKKGYDVPDDLPIFERDIFRIHDKYVHRLTSHVMHESAGFNAGRMAELTEMAPGMLGGVAGTTKYSWRMGELDEATLARLPGTVRKAVERTEKANRRAIKAQFQAAQSAEQSLLRVRAALEGQLDLGGRAGQASAATRRSLGAVGRDAGAVQRDLNTAIGQWRDVLRKQKQGLVDADTFKGLQTDLAERIKGLRSELTETRRGVATRRPLAKEAAAEKGADLFAQEAGEVARLQKKVDAAMRHMQEAISEQNRLAAMYKMDAAKATPALVPVHSGKVGFVQLQVNGMEDFAMPAYIAKEFHTILDKGKGLTGLHKEYRKVLTWWKKWATIRWPGFHLRNNQGAIFNNLIGGVTGEDYGLAYTLRQAHRGKGREKLVPKKVFDQYGLGTVFTGRLGKVTYGDWVDHISDMGIGSVGHGTIFDVRTAGEAAEKALRMQGKRAAMQRMGRWYDKKLAQPATELTENFHRTAAFLGGLRQTGGDPLGARAFTMMRHGDYADLTPFEADFVKDVIPFYKWLRTNLPYQFHQLMENPAALLTVEKAKDTALSGFSPEERAAMPDWQKEAFNIPLPGDGILGAELLTLDLPNSDLHMGAREFFSSFLPLVRPAVESFIVEKSIFTGKPVEGEMIESNIGSTIASIPVVGEILELTGLGKRDAEGKFLVSDKVENLLTTIPAYSRFRNFLWADEGRVEKRANTMASILFGVGLNQLDEESLTKAELSFFYDEVEPYMNMMRDLGVQFPTKDDLDPSVFSTLGLETPAAA